MRTCFIAILVGVLACGCGDDDDGPSPAGDEDGDARRDSGAAESDGDAGQVTDEAEIRALLTEFVAQWDRVIRASCGCYVEMGAFPSVDTCFGLVGSGPTWIECGTRALVKRGLPYERADAECNIAASKARADCIEAASCDDLTPCDRFMNQCPMRNEELTTLVLAECPDTGLLSRLDGGS
jgi:hypothetical protein